MIPTAALADAQLPDFSQLTTISSVAVIGSALVGLYAFATGRSLAEAQEFAFVGLVVIAIAGLLLYLALLIEGVL